MMIIKMTIIKMMLLDVVGSNMIIQRILLDDAADLTDDISKRAL